jgi:D-aminopeptidase
MRARDLGISIGRGTPGDGNAITDVSGVLIGHETIVRGDGALVMGRGPVRTGVTVIVPHERIGREPLFAGCHRLNGNGELTGLEWIRESGLLTTPIAITNTHSVGVVRDALIAYDVRSREPGDVRWSLPVVGETWDGMLNDINGFHVGRDHVFAALDAASDGAVAEGNVGGGTGMICHEFKGGIGTASRRTEHGFTVGVLVQANHGRREYLRVDGVPVGQAIPRTEVPSPYDQTPHPPAPGSGSIIVIVATDAPLVPNQCDRLAQRAGLGIARMGGMGHNSSGDLFLCFSTANAGAIPAAEDRGAGPLSSPVERLSDAYIDELFDGVVESAEESILNALVAAETMTGRDGITAHALPRGRLVEVMGP